MRTKHQRGATRNVSTLTIFTLFLVNTPATVNDDARAGDVRGLRRGEEGDDGGALLRLPDAPKGGERADARQGLRRRAPPRLGQDGARQDCVNAHCWSILDRGLAGQRAERALRRRIRRMSSDALERVHA